MRYRCTICGTEFDEFAVRKGGFAHWFGYEYEAELVCPICFEDGLYSEEITNEDEEE